MKNSSFSFETNRNDKEKKDALYSTNERRKKAFLYIYEFIYSLLLLASDKVCFFFFCFCSSFMFSSANIFGFLAVRRGEKTKKTNTCQNYYRVDRIFGYRVCVNKFYVYVPSCLGGLSITRPSQGRPSLGRPSI